MNTVLILNYLTDLEQNNCRDWYHGHKEEYKAANAEFEALIRSGLQEIPVSAMINPHTIPLSGPILRPWASCPCLWDITS